ncbi:hypothetical protein LCGC14_2483930, partial [marine sediment metagenome]
MSYCPSEIHFIFELQLQAERYFPNASFRLEVSIDPENGSKDLQFIISHHWQTSVDTAHDQMEKFTREWYIYNMQRAKDLLIINEFSSDK